MARIRTIKPEFFTSLTIADLTPEQRLTFIGLWTHADDAGRCVDDPRLIKAAIWPLDDRTAADIEVDLKALTESSLITRYTLNQKRYLAVTNWAEHQRINRPTESKLPAPEDGHPAPPEPPTSKNADSYTAHGAFTEDSRQERKGKEQGREGNREGERASADAESGARAEVMEAQRPDGLAPIDIDGFEVNDGMRRWAHRDGYAALVDIDHATAQFISHYRSTGARRKSWPDAWQKWIRDDHQRAVERQQRRGSPSNVIDLASGQPLPGTDTTVAGWDAVAADLRAKESPA